MEMSKSLDSTAVFLIADGSTSQRVEAWQPRSEVVVGTRNQSSARSFFLGLNDGSRILMQYDVA